MQLHEQYRPADWADVVGQDKVLAKLDRLRKRGLTGRSYWLTGQSGSGKTTIARLIASEVASEWCIEEIDSTGLSDARVREIERQSKTYGIGEKNGRAYIVNEVRSERIVAGQAAARAAGKTWGGSKKGRRIRVTTEQISTIHWQHEQGQKVAGIARAVGLSRPTVYSVLREVG